MTKCGVRSGRGQEVGDTIRVWIVDADGTRLFFEAETRERAGFKYDRRQLEQEIQGIVDSIRFD